ncbi:MAG: hypothetical protein S4CHLAM45_09080 [Chlamydiales bacterium]|nr:hypothetical protein [Chlamydiales bacterium]MCH9620540.1 hypothetical protein [Chlamydiales bacterium]MCH9623012.1 hypothetical protein [Chlamydiales bacterium]
MNTGNGSTELKKLQTSNKTELFYLGEPVEKGPLPTFVYFSLSGEESLTLPPYNQPALYLSQFPCRVFSVTLPGHGPQFDKFVAMDYWAEQIKKEHRFLETFFETTAEAISSLVDEGVIEKGKLAFGGLSRGAFAATHIAAQEPHVTTLLGHAPLTELSAHKSFANLSAKELNLTYIIPKLSHLKDVRFYIGDKDTLVGTHNCTHFIQELCSTYPQMSVELKIKTPSIGMGGHGTSPETFEEGAAWVKQKLFGE